MRRPGAAVRRAIHDATACREALLRLPQSPASFGSSGAFYTKRRVAYLSRELLMRAVATDAGKGVLGLSAAYAGAAASAPSICLSSATPQEVRIRPVPEMSQELGWFENGRVDTLDVLGSMTASLGMRNDFTVAFTPRGKITGTAGRDRSSSD